MTNTRPPDATVERACPVGMSHLDQERRTRQEKPQAKEKAPETSPSRKPLYLSRVHRTTSANHCQESASFRRADFFCLTTEGQRTMTKSSTTPSGRRSPTHARLRTRRLRDPAQRAQNARKRVGRGKQIRDGSSVLFPHDPRLVTPQSRRDRVLAPHDTLSVRGTLSHPSHSAWPRFSPSRPCRVQRERSRHAAYSLIIAHGSYSRLGYRTEV